MPEQEQRSLDICANSVNLAASLYEFVFHFSLTSPEWQENPAEDHLLA